jgi:hypothetical protein
MHFVVAIILSALIIIRPLFIVVIIVNPLVLFSSRTQPRSIGSGPAYGRACVIYPVYFQRRALERLACQRLCHMPRSASARRQPCSLASFRSAKKNGPRLRAARFSQSRGED